MSQDFQQLEYHFKGIVGLKKGVFSGDAVNGRRERCSTGTVDVGGTGYSVQREW